MTWFIIILTVFLRLPLLGQSLWLDESIEALALMGKMGPILEYALKDFQPPLYHFIGMAWTSLVGYSEIALRTPSLVSGLITVYFVLKLGKLLGGDKVGIIAGILAATNPLLIYYSAEGRTYMMTTAFVTGNFYFLFKLLKEKSTPMVVTSYMLLTIGAIWTSYIAWVVAALQFVYLLLIHRKDLAKLTLIAALTLLLWLPSFLSSLGIGLGVASASPEWGRVVGGISFKALALTWVKFVIGRISFDNKYFYAGIVIVLFLLHKHILRFIRKPNPILFVWLGSVILAAFISLFIPVYSYFRVLFTLPAYLLLLSLGLSRLGKPWFYALTVAQLICVGIYYTTPRFHHEDWKSLVKDINAGDGAVAMPSLAQKAPLIYYGLARKPFEAKQGITTTDKRIFYIKYVEDLFDVEGKGRANLNTAGYNIVQSRTYPGLQLDIYENSR